MEGENKTISSEPTEGAPVSTETISKEMERRDQYKLYVTNLKTWMTQKEAQKLFQEKKVDGIKYEMNTRIIGRSVKKQRGKQFAFVTFHSVESRDLAREVIEQIEVEGKKLKCKDVFSVLGSDM